MDVAGRVAIVTGGGGGIGAALAHALAARGAKVLVADLDGAGAAAVAAEIERSFPGYALALAADVSASDQIEALIASAEEHFGYPDLYLANAGVNGGAGLATDDEWAATFDVNLSAHVRAARLLVPVWLDRGSGYFVSTASAAGLLTQVGWAPYAVSKHAAVAFAEWLAVTYGARGIGVSCLCPMGVDTDLLNESLEEAGGHEVGARVVAAAGAVLSPQRVATTVIEAVAEERFLILPHPEVLEFFRRKGLDYDRWIAGMRRLQDSIKAEVAGSSG